MHAVARGRTAPPRQQVAVPTFSLMLSAFALVAWLIVGLARPSRWVLTGAATMAIGGIVALHGPAEIGHEIEGSS